MKRFFAAITAAAVVLMTMLTAAPAVYAAKADEYELKFYTFTREDCLEVTGAVNGSGTVYAYSYPEAAFITVDGILERCKVGLLSISGFAAVTDAQATVNGSVLAEGNVAGYDMQIGCADNGDGTMKVVLPLELEPEARTHELTVQVSGTAADGKHTVQTAQVTVTLDPVKEVRTAMITGIEAVTDAYDRVEIAEDEIRIYMMEDQPGYAAIRVTFAKEDGSPFEETTYSYPNRWMEPTDVSFEYDGSYKLVNSRGTFLSSVDAAELDGKQVRFILETKAYNWQTQEYTVRVLTGAEKKEAFVLLTSRAEGAEGQSLAPLTGGGKYALGSEAVVGAPDVEGYHFEGWYDEQGQLRSEQKQFAFAVEGETKLTAVYKPTANITLKVHGRDYAVNGKEKKSDMKSTFSAGVQIELQYVGNKKFLYWKNAQGKIVSTAPEYGFKLLRTTELSVVAVSQEENVQFALVEFIGADGRIVMMDTWYSAENAALYSMPEGTWEIDGESVGSVEEILARIGGTTKYIQVRQVVKDQKEDTPVIVTVRNNVDSLTAKDSCSRGETIALSAEEKEGYTFTGWAMDAAGEICLGTEPQLELLASESMTVYALYAAGDTEVQAQPHTQITGAFAKTEDESDRIHVFATTSVPQSFAAVSSGILWASAEEVSAQDMVVGGRKVNAEGTDRITIEPPAQDVQILVRSWCTVEDEQGNTVTTYSAVHSISFHDLLDGWLEQDTGSEGNETPQIPLEPEDGNETPAVPVEPEDGNETPAVPLEPENGNETPAVPVTPENGNETPAVPLEPEDGNETPAVPLEPEDGNKTPAVPIG